MPLIILGTTKALQEQVQVKVPSIVEELLQSTNNLFSTTNKFFELYHIDIRLGIGVPGVHIAHGIEEVDGRMNAKGASSTEGEN